MAPRIKRKKNYLTVKQRLDVIKLKEQGLKLREIGDKFNISTSCVSRIIKKKFIIEQLAKDKHSLNVVRFKKEPYYLVNKTLYNWFELTRASGLTVGGKQLKFQASFFADKLGIQGFRASNGWLEKFLKRHNITLHTVKGEKLSADVEAAETFKKEFQAIVRDGRYTLAQLYSGDECGMHFFF